MKKFVIMLTALAAAIPAAPQIAAASTGSEAAVQMHQQTRTVTRTRTTYRDNGAVVRRSVTRRGPGWNRGRHYGARNHGRTVCTVRYRNHQRVRVCRTIR